MTSPASADTPSHANLRAALLRPQSSLSGLDGAAWSLVQVELLAQAGIDLARDDEQGIDRTGASGCGAGGRRERVLARGRA
jgi:hypothetical protein